MIEDVVVKKFVFAISPPDEFLVKPCCYISHTDIYQLFMAAVCNRAGHYIFALWFVLLSSSIFFPRLISAVKSWMSTILAHMMWPYCEFRMQISNVLCDSLKIQDTKNRQKSPSGHHRTTLSGCIFATKAHIDNGKNLLKSNISSTCPQNMVNVGPLTTEIGLPVWDTPLISTGFASWQRVHGTLMLRNLHFTSMLYLRSASY